MPFISVGAWSGMSAVALCSGLQTGLSGGSDTSGGILLAGILLLLLLGGISF